MTDQQKDALREHSQEMLQEAEQNHEENAQCHVQACSFIISDDYEGYRDWCTRMTINMYWVPRFGLGM